MTERGAKLWIGGCVALGLTLRLLSATGGLWLDEAWSMTMARDVGSPLGVLLGINHDNNHHLNSLWLLFVGIDAPPVVQRALSIASGAGAIWVAGLIGLRRSGVAGLVTAVAFAVSPVLVTFGSEARGYAPMTLALLMAIWLVDRWLAGEPVRRWHLAVTFAVGMLSQLTMAAGIVAVTGWAAFALWVRAGLPIAVRRVVVQFWPGWVATFCVIGIVLFGAFWIGSGFRFGNYAPFRATDWIAGQAEMIGFTIGWPTGSDWMLGGAVGLLVLAQRIGVCQMPLHWLAIVGFPLGLMLVQAGNVGHPRYYLTVGIALLIMSSEVIALGLLRRGWRRWIAAGGLAAFAVGSAAQDVELIQNHRGHPEQIITVLKMRAPAGTRLAMDRETEAPVFEVAAAQARYPLTLVAAPCPAERFLIVERFRGESLPARPSRCGVPYRIVAHRSATGMSGMHWTLYERAR
jgi:hypothetical protein